MNCSICGKKSGFYICEECMRMHNDPRIIEIWEQNKALADSLGKAYFKPTLESYGKNAVKKNGMKNLSFNLFCEGITLGLDVTMPFLGNEELSKAKNKIAELIETRKSAKNREKRAGVLNGL